MSPTPRDSRKVPFLQDGCRRARAAAEAEIRQQVQAEFAERLSAAGWFEAFRLRREIKREIERRVDEIAPSHGQYLA